MRISINSSFACAKVVISKRCGIQGENAVGVEPFEVLRVILPPTFSFIITGGEKSSETEQNSFKFRKDIL